MNEIPRGPGMGPTMQAAEGVPRLRWTVAELARLAELGVVVVTLTDLRIE